MTDALHEDWLTVTQDPDELAGISALARETAKRRADNVIAALPEIRGFISCDWVEMLEHDREISVARLSQIASDNTLNRAGVNAALFLCRLLEPSGLAHLRYALEQGSDEQRSQALKGIADSLVLDRDRKGDQGRFWLSDSLLVSAVVEQLDHPSEKVVDEAVAVCGKLQLDLARGRVLELARDPGKVNLGAVFHWLCKWPISEELLQIGIEASRASIETKFRQTVVIREAAYSSRPDFRERVKIDLQRQLDHWPCGNDYAHLGYRPEVAAAAGECCTVEDLPWLRRRIAEDSGWSVRELLRAMVRIEGADGAGSLIGAIREKRHRADAFLIAGELFRGSANQALALEIAWNLPDLRGDELAGACQALVEIGAGDSNYLVKSNLPRLEAWRRAHLEALIDALPLNEIVSAVIKGEVIDEGTAKCVSARLAKEATTSGRRKSRLIDVLSAGGIVAWFDVETDQLPCRHDRLIEKLAQTSRSVFLPDAVSEEWHQEREDDYDAEYTLRFIYSGRGYLGKIRNFGDWYDVERTVTMVNRALCDAGKAERYITIDSGDQSAILVFARPDRLNALAHQFHLPISQDMNKSMETGVTFERQMFEQFSD